MPPVVVVEAEPDVFDQVAASGPRAALEVLAGKAAQQDFCLIEPGSVDGQVYEADKLAMTPHPAVHVGVDVAGAIVQNEMEPSHLRPSVDEELEAPQKVLVVIALKRIAGRSTPVDIEESQQVHGAMAPVMELAAAGAPRLDGEVLMETFDGLDAGLLVQADDLFAPLSKSCRLLVAPQHSCSFRDELGVLGVHPIVPAVRLEVRFLQNHPHGTVVDGGDNALTDDGGRQFAD
jgi:hypothetical protein